MAIEVKYIKLFKNDILELMNALMLKTRRSSQIRQLQNQKNYNNKSKDTTSKYQMMIFIPNSQIWAKCVWGDFALQLAHYPNSASKQ